jgi:riboflavin kinase / FMN adenylyltransferase
MKVIRGYSGEPLGPYPVGTIGNFDGHHLGHQALLKQVIKTAHQAQGTALVVTFHPHPVKILAPTADLRFLTDEREKVARFERAGIDGVVFLEFTQTFASLSPEAFADQILSKELGLKEVFVGQHFAFGHKRAGTINDLTFFGHRFGFIVHPTPPVMIAGSVVSSTRIRQLILSGEVNQASDLLGRHYAITGVVTPGEGRGRTLGWPTANLQLPSDRVVPADGIYASITVIKHERHDSVAYIGTRPTFAGADRLLEVTILDGTHNLYGHNLTVEFIDRIREDVHFDEVAALRRQIASDVESAKTILRRHHQAIGG